MVEAPEGRGVGHRQSEKERKCGRRVETVLLQSPRDRALDSASVPRPERPAVGLLGSGKLPALSLKRWSDSSIRSLCPAEIPPALRHKGCQALPAFLSPRETHLPDVRSTRPTARAKCKVKERPTLGASDWSGGGGHTSSTPQAHFRALYGGGPWGLLPSRHCQALSPIRRAGGKQACQDLGSPGWLG